MQFNNVVSSSHSPLERGWGEDFLHSSIYTQQNIFVLIQKYHTNPLNLFKNNAVQ